MDFTSDSIYTRLGQDLNGFDIGVLINNVGMGYKSPLYFEEFCQNEQSLNDIIACNCLAVTKMTAIVLPRMIAKQRGVIVNVASVSGIIPAPFLAVYSATKAYVNYFSRLV